MSTWAERWEEGLVHLGDYDPEQDAHPQADPVSMSAGAPRAETRTTEQSAQKPRKTWDQHQAELDQACGGVGAALTAAFTPLAVWTLSRLVRALTRLQRALRR